jgi:2-polyprenyl-6-hydroxyphenyl methylase/3-demethylubiquinone-9 3-methyltransferase
MVPDIQLKSPGVEPRPCKICGQKAPVVGVVDFNRSCEELRGKFLPPAGIPVSYQRCSRCGFLFTACFDDWIEADFKAHIYNDEYIKVDPDYLEARPAANAAMLVEQVGDDRSKLRILDYGGGNGVLARRMRDAGFSHVTTYDPFSPEFARRPEGQFDLITSFETFEHLPDPLTAIDVIASMLSPNGVVMFSTLLQPQDLGQRGLSWWYAGPRNGHISLFSAQSLAIAWQRHGLSVSSFNENLHLAYRDNG